MVPNSDAQNAINILQPLFDARQAENAALALAIQALQGLADTQFKELTAVQDELAAKLAVIGDLQAQVEATKPIDALPEPVQMTSPAIQ